ncbi:MAG: FGGY-family carbohydrate kinase [Nannocystaceae bacterium]|nr:FGGY-family carbohydrate kinase [Nannocystaceae bacterium]
MLAIDLGTSGPKVAVTTAQGEIVDGVSHPTTLNLPDGGGAEQDPHDWWRAIVAATQQLHARGAVDPKRIEVIGVTAQWAGTVAIDKEGNPLHDALIWMDSRGAKYTDEITGGLLKVEGYAAQKLYKWIRRTGGAPSLIGKEPLSHILFLKHERPDVFREAHKFLEPKDWLNLRLTGRAVSTYDTIALHWVTDNRDISRVRYDDDLLAYASLSRDRLPPLVGATDIIGTLTQDAARELGLRPEVKVVGGTPDVQSAAIGSGAVRDFEAHVYIGTSSWLTCHVPFKKTNLGTNMASLPSPIPNRYFVANEQQTAGKCLEWLRDAILCRDDALNPGGPPADALRRFDALAEESPPGSDGVIFTPWLYGERCPVADNHVRSTFFNQSLRTNRTHLVRAVMEGVAYNSRWLLDAVEKFCGRRLEPIRMIGGGARSELWCQIYADVLNRRIDQVEDPVQCNARGAALIAALGMGWTDVDAIPGLVQVRRTFTPRAEHRATYDALYREFRELYRVAKPIHARLAAR